MSAVFTIAGLTLKEALRRRFVVAGLFVAAGFFLLAFIPIHPRQHLIFTPAEMQSLVAQITATYGGEIAEFCAFLFAIALAAGSISSEIERGVLSVILPKPIPRWQVYCGKWLGINLFIVPFLAFWTALLEWAIFRHVHVFYEPLWHAFPIMALYPIVFSSLTLFFSSFTSNLLATIMPLLMASTAWTEGLLRFFGYAFDVATLKFLAKAVVYVAPLNPLSRWFERENSPTLLLQILEMRPRPGGIDPPANYIDLGWILAYGLIAFVAGMIIFQKRDL